MRNGAMHSCARICHECQDECLSMILPCLELGGPHAAPGHQRLLLDCASVCHMSENFMHRESEYASLICRACAQICRACAESCERLAHGTDDDRHRRCATICRRCAESCELMNGA